jgi:DNA-binding transcriptional MerR regulator
MAEPEIKWKRGELAEACGVNSETLRFYEKAGLLNPERGSNGYRLYGVSDAKRIRLAQRAVGVGFSLQDVKAWIAGDGSKMEQALVRVEAKIEELERLRKSLRKKLRKV